MVLESTQQVEGVDDTNCMGKCSWHTREGEVREAPTGKNQVPAQVTKRNGGVLAHSNIHNFNEKLLSCVEGKHLSNH